VPQAPFTCCFDCGGTGLKALVVDAGGIPVTERVRTKTPYPCPPERFVASLVALANRLDHPVDRVSVGMPGLVRGGVVRATPHYVTESGPFTPRRPDLVAAWQGFDAQGALAAALGRPTRVLNDTEIAGLAVVEGHGYEVVMTFGTGMGFAQFDDGRLLPKLELSQAPFRDGQTFDEQLGHHARKAIGNDQWTARVRDALDALRPVLWWDRLVIGGGGAKHFTGPLGNDVRIVGNVMGLLGGVRLWDPSVSPAPLASAG
jgi:polyphosphate glucokinase